MMYLVQKLHKIAHTSMGSVDFTTDKELAGFLLVFNTKKAAKKYAGKDSIILELEATQSNDENSK